MREYVDPEFVEIGRTALPQGRSKEFYEGYCVGFKMAIEVLSRFKDTGVVPKQYTSVITTAVGGFLIAGSEAGIWVDEEH